MALDTTEYLVGESDESLLCFTLTGEEHVGAPSATRKLHEARFLGRYSRLQSTGPMSHCALEDILTAGVVCSGVNVVGQDGFPRCHEPTVRP